MLRLPQSPFAARIFFASAMAFVSLNFSVQAQTIDRLDTIGPYLGDCVRKKLRKQNQRPRGSREVTFRLSFRANGTLLGEPHRTFSMPDASQPEQEKFITDISNAIKSCTPLLFSKELAGAIAGRPYNFRYRLQPKQDLRA